MVLIIAVITFIVALLNNILCPINKRGGQRVMRDPRDGLLSYMNPFAFMSEADASSQYS